MIILGAVLACLVIAFWSWWADVRADVSWAAFWRPVRDVTMHGKPWIKIHLLAHLIGGALIALALLAVDVRLRAFPDVSLTASWWMRALWLLPFQALWERIQHENFESWTKYIKPDGTVVERMASAYPWWSAVWDVQITAAAWSAVELGRVALMLIKG